MCAHTRFTAFLRLLCNWRNHNKSTHTHTPSVRALFIPGQLGCVFATQSFPSIVKRTEFETKRDRCQLIKQYKSCEISTVIFYEANYLRDNWFDVCSICSVSMLTAFHLLLYYALHSDESHIVMRFVFLRLLSLWCFFLCVGSKSLMPLWSYFHTGNIVMKNVQRS